MITVLLTSEEYLNLLHLGEGVGLFCNKDKFDGRRWVRGLVAILGRERAHTLITQPKVNLRIIHQPLDA